MVCWWLVHSLLLSTDPYRASASGQGLWQMLKAMFPLDNPGTTDRWHSRTSVRDPARCPSPIAPRTFYSSPRSSLLPSVLREASPRSLSPNSAARAAPTPPIAQAGAVMLTGPCWVTRLQPRGQGSHVCLALSEVLQDNRCLLLRSVGPHPHPELRR